MFQNGTKILHGSSLTALFFDDKMETTSGFEGVALTQLRTVKGVINRIDKNKWNAQSKFKNYVIISYDMYRYLWRQMDINKTRNISDLIKKYKLTVYRLKD